MSIRSLTALAVERDRAPAHTPALGGPRGTVTPPLPAPASTPAPGGPSTGEAGVPQSFVDALTSAIPTEPLAAYTAVIAIVTAAVGSDAHSYLPFRWSTFVGFLVLTATATVVSYRSKSTAASPGELNASAGNERPVPWLEFGTALVAAAAWGLAMPGGPLSALLTGPAELIATGTTVILGAALVTVAAGPLTSGTSINRPLVNVPQPAALTAGPSTTEATSPQQNVDTSVRTTRDLL